ncbi:uncharacterized protein LOC128865026 [Anastrepha ludens]|uniref:uncharacterized protein LOC128865026 n=1 Tax=Anastrepha ludens TaxID=28586 RepID=UPI0023AE8C9C|nr:uncharacterized protein LOC128865026 [Anastrepha ludens]
MSRRVRRFLKQVREQKEEELKREVTTKRVTINDTPELAIDNQIKSQTLNEAESLDVVFTPSVNHEICKDFNTSLQRCTSPSMNPKGKYVNWMSKHTELATQPWCCVGDLMAFCDKYEYRTLSLSDTRAHNNIVSEVKALLTVGQAPFDLRKRFPGNIHNPENLWICIGRSASVEYHLKKILSVFRKPLLHLPVDKQRVARENFHLAVNELRLDISARISAVQLYDRNIFEREFHLHWQDAVE